MIDIWTVCFTVASLELLLPDYREEHHVQHPVELEVVDEVHP